MSEADNLTRIVDQGLLAKRSRTRAEDVIRRIIRPRLIEPGPHVIPALKSFLSDGQAFREACYYETSRDEKLLALFAEEPLYAMWNEGRLGVTIPEVIAWQVQMTVRGHLPTWTDTVRLKVARGMLAALRDFGILAGDNTKLIVPPNLSPRGFSYVAWRLHEVGGSSRSLSDSHVWRRWLLDATRVSDLFRQATRLGVMSVSTAGSAVRIDWHASNLQEVMSAVAG
ncbi:hypothetical protein JOF57_004043 [Mycolicibacterium lutetiense]|uniref:Uncharacterized protein n=2 Tax=Mycolicibacterium lutetiense TaxID=1641992 RepID=A0ABS4ZX78_9MYCO|nr:hypothetical protein [Mycolicibacterium lutetiense]